MCTHCGVRDILPPTSRWKQRTRQNYEIQALQGSKGKKLMRTPLNARSSCWPMSSQWSSQWQECARVCQIPSRKARWRLLSYKNIACFSFFVWYTSLLMLATWFAGQTCENPPPCTSNLLKNPQVPRSSNAPFVVFEPPNGFFVVRHLFIFQLFTCWYFRDEFLYG